jgi:hypothetical protein
LRADARVILGFQTGHGIPNDNLSVPSASAR